MLFVLNSCFKSQLTTVNDIPQYIMCVRSLNILLRTTILPVNKVRLHLRGKYMVVHKKKKVTK